MKSLVNKFRQLTLPQCLSLTIIAVISLLVFAYYSVTPYYADDLYFGCRWHDYVLGLSDLFDWNEYARWIIYQITDDSPRFFNLLIPLFLYLPKSIFNILSSLIFGLTVYLSARCCGISTNNPLRLAMMTICILLLFPWEDGMTSISHTLNYLWVSLTVLLFLLAFNQSQAFSTPGLIAIGIFAGWGHETIGTALISGCIMWLLINRKAMNSRRLYLCLSLLVVTLALLSVMTFGRFTNHLFFKLNTSAESIVISHLIYDLLTKYNLVVLSIALLLVALTVRRSRTLVIKMLQGGYPLVFTAMLTSTVEGIVLGNIGARVSWFPQFFGLLSSAMLMNCLFPHPLLKKYIGYGLSFILLLIMQANLVAGTLITNRQSQQFKSICHNYLMKERPEPFHDMSAMISPSPIAFNRLPLSISGRERLLWTSFSRFYAGRDMDYPVPSSLRNIVDGDLTKIPGDNPFYRHSSGWIVRAESSDNANDAYVITPHWGVRQEASYEYVPFTAADGRHWEVAYNIRTDAQARWAGIEKIDQRR